MSNNSKFFIIGISDIIEDCLFCEHAKGTTKLELTALLNGIDYNTKLYNTELYNADYISKEFMADLGRYLRVDDAARISDRIDAKLDNESIMFFAVGCNSEWLVDKIKKSENINIIYITEE